MNITVNVDEISLDTVVGEIFGWDEDGDTRAEAATPGPQAAERAADLTSALQDAQAAISGLHVKSGTEGSGGNG